MYQYWEQVASGLDVLTIIATASHSVLAAWRSQFDESSGTGHHQQEAEMQCLGHPTV